MNRCKKMTYYAKISGAYPFTLKTGMRRPPFSGPYPFTSGIRVRFSDPFNPFNPQSGTNVGRFAQNLTKSKKSIKKIRKLGGPRYAARMDWGALRSKL